MEPRGGAVKAGPLATAEAQRILDRAARRLLAASLDRDSVGPTAGTNDGSIDNSNDEGAALVEGERVPVASADGDRGRGGRG
jgi:hypothetical protein